MKRTVNMTLGSPMKLLIAFALPLMFGNIFQQLYTVVDTAIVGRGVGMVALAALGTVDWLNWMFLGIAQGFTQGFSVRMAQKFGEQDDDGLKRTVGVSAIISLILALVVTGAAQVFLPQLLNMLNVPENLYPIAMRYCRIILGGFPAVMFFNFCSSCLRAIGDSKTPLYAMMIASVTNIALDCLAVFVLKWGIAGAALATVFSQCLAGCICAIKIAKTSHLRFSKSHLGAGTKQMLDLMKIGSPIAGKNIIIALGGMYVQSVANGFDLSFIAGYTATNKLYGLLEIAAISYGYAVTTYVGQNYGAMQLQRIKKGMGAAVALSLGTAVIIVAIMIVFGRSITMLFISSQNPLEALAAGETAYQFLCAMSIMLPVLYLLYAFQSALQGIGNTLASMISGFLELCVRVGVATAVAYTGHQTGLFMAEVIAWLIATVFLALSYRSNIRKLFRKATA